MAKKPLDTLLKCLQERDITIDRVDLQKSLDGEYGATIEAWIEEYLGAETLLTKDELSLYSMLQKSGDVEILEETQDLAQVRGFSDQELQIAIEDLRRSTAAVEKQTESLQIQQDALSSLVKINSQNYEARSTINKSQYKAWSIEIRTVTNEVEEILQSLRFQITEIEAQRNAAKLSLHNNASEMMRSDDKLLLSFQKLASDLEPAQPKDDENEKCVRDLCARLIKHTVEGVRCRLDKVYLEAVNGQPSYVEGEIAEDSEVTALRGELESLYSEILPVAQMSAEQQFLEPALRAISAQDDQRNNRSQKALAYISECLTFLITRLEAFTSRAEEHQSHHHATSLFLATARAELDALPPPPIKGAKSASSSSPTRRRKSQSKLKGTSPVRPRTTRRRSSATSFDDDTPAEEQLLQNLGISLPGTGSSERAVAKAMADALAERTAKLALHARSVQEGTEAAIASHFHDAFVTLDVLRESLLSETSHKTVRLMDREVEEAIGHLEAEVEDVKSTLKGLDVAKLKEKNVTRDELVERWSR